MANKDKDEKVKKNKKFFKDFKAELKRVTWPTPKQLVNNTIGVIIIVIIVAIIVFILDLTFDSINKYGINRLKGIVENTGNEIVAEETLEGNNDVTNTISTETTDTENTVEVQTVDTEENETNEVNEAADTTNITE